MRRIAGLALLTVPLSAAAQDAGLLESLRSGQPVVDLRLRNEYVDDSRFGDAANATTLRSVLGYRSGAWNGISLYAEAEAVASVLDDDTYDNGGVEWNRVDDRPVIVDPVGVGMNQAYVRWSDDRTSITVGRQEIVLGNARFVGNVGWRQNHQSFDAAVLSTKALKPVTAMYAFVREIHRITAAQNTVRAHVVDLSAAVSGYGTLSVTGLLLDVRHAPTLSTATVGAAFTGGRAVSDGISVLYDVSVATQSDAADHPNEDLSALYTRLEFGVKGTPGAVRIGRESLGGSPEDGQFTTTLATLHQFNGWADQFLATPTNGLVDLYASVSAMLAGAGVTVTYHDFTAETGDARYGGEIDVQVTHTLRGGPELGAKIAHFMGDSMDRDVTKVWVWAAIGL